MRDLLAALRRLEIYLVCDLMLRGNFCIDAKLYNSCLYQTFLCLSCQNATLAFSHEQLK